MARISLIIVFLNMFLICTVDDNATEKVDSFSHFPYGWDLTRWDWVSVLIAILALLIAFVAMIIALRTLKSQRKTEQNTQPIITIEVQRLLFRNIICCFFKNTAILQSLRVLKSLNTSSNPEVYVIHKLKIKETDIHEELYFSNDTYFNYICSLKEKISSYNLYIESIISSYPSIGISLHNLDMIEFLANEAVHTMFITIGNVQSEQENTVLFDGLMNWIDNTVQEWREEAYEQIVIPKGVKFRKIDSLCEFIYTRDKCVDYFDAINDGSLYFYKKYSTIGD